MKIGTEPFAQHVGKRKKLHTTFWEVVLLRQIIHYLVKSTEA